MCPFECLGALPGGEIPDSDGFCHSLRTTTVRPSALNATLLTSPVCPSSVWVHCPVVRSQTRDGFVMRSGHDGAPVRTQRHAVDFPGVSFECFGCTARW